MSARATYLVTPADTRLPAVRLVAVDEVDLGSQVAQYFARNRRLVRGIRYWAEVGDDVGAITQPGLPRPLTFTIAKEG
jgi:hypothetical protein